MKTKTSKQPKHSKPAVHLKDIKPKQDANGGRVSNVPERWFSAGPAPIN